MIDEYRSPAARAFNANVRAVFARLELEKKRWEENERWLAAMGRRPLSRPEARIYEPTENANPGYPPGDE
jgi:hypothetical protein